MASSVAQAPVTREHLNTLIAELFGDPPARGPQAPAGVSTAGPRWQQAVTQVDEQLRTKLRVEVLPERMRKALEFVHADAVTIQADGTASVKSGTQTYTLSPECPCADAKNRKEFCKHALAVELHRRALALFHGTPAEPPPPPSLPPPQRRPAPARRQQRRLFRPRPCPPCPARPRPTRGTCTKRPPARASSSASGPWSCSTRCVGLMTPNCSAA